MLALLLLALGARFTSDLTVYDEAMHEGRLVGRYWSAIGRLRAEREIRPAEFASPWSDAFYLEIGGKPVGPGWAWMGFENGIATLTRENLRLKVHTRTDGTPVLMRWLEITNTGTAPLPLSGVAPFAGDLWRMKRAEFKLGRFRGTQWGNEGDFGWESLPPGLFAFDNGGTGMSGFGSPYFIVRNQATGDWFAGALGWSGEWVIEFYREGGTLSFRARPSAQRVIAPGETVTTPVMHLAHLTGDLDAVVQAMHDHIRRSVLPPQPEGRAQRIEDNHWGYQSGIETEEGIRKLIDVAASVGVELFIHDAGWYGSRRNDWPGQSGDWRPGPWLPNGLKPLSDYAHSKGLLFGLWMEPEAAGKNSRLLREHPEFVVQSGSRSLDLTRPEVARWVEAEMARVISEYGVDLLRWDYAVGHRVGNQWRHYEVLYGILERLRRKFPRVIFENCASGGGRADLGMLRYAHTTWITDTSTLPKSLRILNGMTLLLPPEICNRTYGTQHDDQRLFGDLDTQLRVALFGHPTAIGIAPSLEEMIPANTRRVRHAFDLYKSFIRPMLPAARVYHHTPVDAEHWVVLEYAARDRSRAYAGLFRLSTSGDPEYRFHPRGLKLGETYRVTFDNSGEAVVRTGYDLVQQGIRVRLENGIRSELLLIEAVKP